jgi:hypothetical protein
MGKNKKNAVITLVTLAALIVLVFFVAPAVQKRNKPIPFGQAFEDINDLAGQLNVSVDIFEAYLTAIGSDYDEYVKYLNEIQMTPKQLTDDVHANVGYSYSDYVQTMTLISNKTTPDANLYDKIATGGTTVSETAEVDVYVSKTGRANLESNNIKILPTTIGDDETVKLFHLFALMAYVGGDIPTFISGASGVFGCESVELSCIEIYADYGVKMPGNKNKMLEDLFVTENGEICKIIPMPVLTLKYAGETKNISFGVINSAGLIFTAKDAEVLRKLNDTAFFDMHVRQLQIPVDPTAENAENIG